MRQKISTRKLAELNVYRTNQVARSEILLIGCSAGGFNLVFDLLLALPAGFPLPVVVIIHRSRRYKSSVEALLHQRSKVPVTIAGDKEEIRNGHVYFAPPDYHLLCEPSKIFALDVSEPVYFCRPAIDVTFQSFADVYGDRTMAIVLSGANADGAEGLSAVESVGGLAIIQDPREAEVPTMPEAALKLCNQAWVLSNNDLFAFMNLIATLKNNPVG